MHVSVRWLLILVLWLAALPSAAPARAAAAPLRLRIGVTTDGIIRLTPADLRAAGMDPTAVDSRTFAMSSLGRPVAVRVTGESDGHFDEGDFIEFFGQRFRGPEMDQKYTDERVYWLDSGGARGPRILDADATPAYTQPPPADFEDTLHAEVSQVWWTLYTLSLDTEDTWFWARLTPVGTGGVITQTFPYTVPFPAPGAAALFRLEEISRAWSDSVAPDHRTTVALNSTPLFAQAWDGKVRRVFTATVPAGLLVNGLNTAAVGAGVSPGLFADDVYVNYWEVTYRRQFRAWEDRLAFTAEAASPQEYQVGGWSSSAVAMWDISDAAQPTRLTGAAAAADGAGVQLRFRPGGPKGARYWLQAERALTRPTSLRLRPPTGLREPPGGADAVIVAPAFLLASTAALADWHRAHGRRVLVADFQDVCDEFNNGIYHPKAVPAMLAWASAHWSGAAPAYLTLFGDGHWNFKGFNPAAYPPQPNPIPPYLAWVDSEQGEVPADALYGDLDGDGMPDLAVGRLAVNTPAEADVVVNKIVHYDEGIRRQPWQGRALFIADNPDSGGDFPGLSDVIIRDRLPAALTPTRIYLGQTTSDVTSARTMISNAINEGVLMVQYFGHGAPARWTQEGIWRLADVPSLHNAGMLPVVMTFDCLDGYFSHPDPAAFSMAETMQRLAGGGSVAAFSPSGLGFIGDHQVFDEILMDVLFREHVRELGRALTLAKQRYYVATDANSHYLIQTMTLFGDPALQLPVVTPILRYLPAISASK